MKSKISKTLKTTLLAICFLLLASSIAYLLMHLKTPHYMDELYTTYSYNTKSDVNYHVYLGPNILYGLGRAEEGKTYITEFVDWVNTFFVYRFEADRPVPIKGNYEIVALLEGYTGSNDQYQRIWEKNETLLSQTAFETEEANFTINKHVPLNIREYREYIDELIEEANIDSSVRVTLQMNIEYTVDTGQKIIEKTASPTIEIPLNTSYFTISKICVQEENDKIEETIKTQLGPDKTTVFICSVIMLALVLSIIYLFVFTAEPTFEDLYKKEISKIFKLHGSRFIAIKSKISNPYEEYYSVRTIEDLIKMADEINKPIIYEYCPDILDISKFYLIDNKISYIFELGANISKQIMGEENSELVEGEESEDPCAIA